MSTHTPAFFIFLALSISTQSVFGAEELWTGEWGQWAKPDHGAAIKIKKASDGSYEARLRSINGEGHSCDIKGKLEIASDSEAKIEAKALKSARSCKVVLTQNPTASNHVIKALFEGRDCLKFCDSEKSQDLPDEFMKLADEVYSDPLPWPDCQSKASAAVTALCTDAELAKTYLATKADEAATAKLQTTFYVAKSELTASTSDILKDCSAKEDAKVCLKDAIDNARKEAASNLAKLQKLKRRHESDLSTTMNSLDAKKVIANLKGTYSRKFKTGTTSGDQFSATNDLRLDAEDDELSFDVLLNFFDEQECTLSGTAKALKSSRFLYRDAGRGKKSDSKCRLLIFKEDSDLVLTDDPPDSCRSHCGKGGSFTNARFPLSSRK